MKHLLLIPLISFLPLLGVSQTALTADTLMKYDEKIWVSMPGKWVLTKSQVDSVRQARCKHIYVAVEPQEIVHREGLAGGQSLVMTNQGKDIVCVKCFHVTKQVYRSESIQTLSCCDTANVKRIIWRNVVDSTGQKVKQSMKQ